MVHRLCLSCCLLALSFSSFAGNDEQQEHIVLRYADGSANEFTVTQARNARDAIFFLNYNPVRAEKSSSGIYSGGKPARMPLSHKEWEVILRAAIAAADDADSREKTRVKGSGLIEIIYAGRKDTLLLKQQSILKKKLEEILRMHVAR